MNAEKDHYFQPDYRNAENWHSAESYQTSEFEVFKMIAEKKTKCVNFSQTG